MTATKYTQTIDAPDLMRGGASVDSISEKRILRVAHPGGTLQNFAPEGIHEAELIIFANGGNIGGIAAPVPLRNKKLHIYVQNLESVLLTNEDAGSLAENRIISDENPQGQFTLMYDSVNARWIILSTGPGAI